MKVVITTVPFAEYDRTPLELLDQTNGVEYVINPLNRKLRIKEVAEVIGDSDIVVAGTETIDADVFNKCPNLKAICRVGIGVDSVDLLMARQRDIKVTYTPDAPSPAVAELTLGLMLDRLRRISSVDREIRNGIWLRKAGRRISECTVGIVGCGRIGSRVIHHLNNGFPDVELLAHDREVKSDLNGIVQWVELEELYGRCDIISLHLPLTQLTKNLITRKELQCFKEDSILINTSRGGIVNEMDLAMSLKAGELSSAAVDVFEEEPYGGVLCDVENIVLTCHLGSMTQDCRARMEIEAVEEAIRFVKGEPFLNLVPDEEYRLIENLSS